MSKIKYISKNQYRGVRTTATGEPNELTECFYTAKFLKKGSCIRRLQRIAIRELKDEIAQGDYDYITAPNNVVNKFNLAKEIAKAVANRYGITYKEFFTDANTHLRKNLKNGILKDKKILVIDDVFYTGKTAKSLWYLLRNANVKQATFYAVLKSRNFKKGVK